MDSRRRDVLRAGGAAGIWSVLAAVGIAAPAQARDARNVAAFEATTFDDALRALGAEDAAESGAVRIVAPDVAEDGRAVTISVASDIPRTEQIVVLIEENPYKVAASFRLSGAMAPAIQTRVKMARSTRVHALVRAEGRLFVAWREVTVTVGGCGT
ncbi:thiosulfate oxidation carrier protein SoxY [Aromatoleum petrolei]|uniref:Thiosulfate oxidation carrier protein SoxY n=1 Tax=Aromatoleum petrolei TaxID=76116 RepID=A0ABX1MRV7_9RHOO|nr:thiosulfate oxidation carrier protein SoxY [Aromatoleum petrolei]NMF87852.1 thiosulfate oxidation carrier protein SoxY [Aromatoleum petrolei]QTQ35281.1 putative thiosulfate-binding protein [Aromatoleum petrolei]